MRQYSKSFVIAFFVALVIPQMSHAGSEGGGGGFAYKMSRLLLKRASELAKSRLLKAKEDCINQVLRDLALPPIQLAKMQQILGSIRSAPAVTRTRKNLDGDLEPLVFDYGTDEQGPYIIALEPYFISFLSYDGEDEDPTLVKQVDRLIFHEAAHHFGYDENQAAAFAERMVGPTMAIIQPGVVDWRSIHRLNACGVPYTFKDGADLP